MYLQSLDIVMNACNYFIVDILYFQESTSISREFSVGVIKDVIDILMGVSSKHPNRYTEAALSDMHALFNQCKQECKKGMIHSVIFYHVQFYLIYLLSI